MATYPYDFQTCGFAIIDDVRAIVEAQRDWDRSNSLKDARAKCSTAAKRFGIKRLHTGELKALANFLIENKAGLHIATYAWGTYADMKANTDNLFQNVSEPATA